MKFVLSLVLVAVLALLGWIVFSTNTVIREQTQQIQALKTALESKSQNQALSLQTECATTANKFLTSHGFLTSRGWNGPGDWEYQNHFNSKLNKCFVLISDYDVKEDLRTLDLYDAAEGKRYAAYIGHNICATRTEPNRCSVDAGSIWLDGDDSRRTPDFEVGFHGLRYDARGDENTQKSFLNKIQPFMNE